MLHVETTSSALMGDLWGGLGTSTIGSSSRKIANSLLVVDALEGIKGTDDAMTRAKAPSGEGDSLRIKARGRPLPGDPLAPLSFLTKASEDRSLFGEGAAPTGAWALFLLKASMTNDLSA